MNRIRGIRRFDCIRAGLAVATLNPVAKSVKI